MFGLTQNTFHWSYNVQTVDMASAPWVLQIKVSRGLWGGRLLKCGLKRANVKLDWRRWGILLGMDSVVVRNPEVMSVG
jgi:hypothetical protein